MSGCCGSTGYEDVFGEKQARRDARRYRRRGLDRAAHWIVRTVRERGIEGASVLEPGGGIGAIQLELLNTGAGRSTVVELSPGYEAVAADLAREAGLDDRVERRLGDFAADGVAAADVVVLHRVVCCYENYERLLGSAADHARRHLVFTYPPRNAVSRAFFALLNLWLRMRGQDFRAFAHPPEAMLAVVRDRGFEPFASRRGGIWRGAAFARR